MSDHALLQKADLLLSDITTGGGILDPMRTDRFIRRVVDQPTIINECRVVEMTGPTLNLPKIGIGKRVFRAAIENTALTANQRSKPVFGVVPLATSEMMAEIRLSYSQLEDNIERGQLENTVLDLLAEQAALDWEELALLGNKVMTDSDADTQAYLRLQDGLLKRIVSHEVDATTTGISPDTFSAALQAMPQKYLRNKSLFRFYVTSAIEQMMRLTISRRQTQLGDANITGAAPLTIQGIPVKAVALMPNNTGVLFDPQNLILGIQRNMSLESERLIGERQIRIVLTARIALGLEEEEATVQINNFAPVEEEE